MNAVRPGDVGPGANSSGGNSPCGSGLRAGAAEVRSAPVLRLVPAPRTDPESAGPDWGHDPDEQQLPYVQGSLAVDFRDQCGDSFFGPQATPSAELPEPSAWARRMIQAVLETYDGTRSADQLSRWVAPDIRERAQRRGQLTRRRGRRTHRPPVVRTVRTCQPADGVCEVTAVVWADGRVRALALRMCGVDGRWLVTAWELG